MSNFDGCPEDFIKHLAALGFSVIRAFDGEEAVRVIEKNPRCLVLSSDIVQEGYGDGLLTRIVSVRPKPTIIFIQSLS